VGILWKSRRLLQLGCEVATVPCIGDTDCIELVNNGGVLNANPIIAGNPGSTAWPFDAACDPADNNGIRCSPDGMWAYPPPLTRCQVARGAPLSLSFTNPGSTLVSISTIEILNDTCYAMRASVCHHRGGVNYTATGQAEFRLITSNFREVFPTAGGVPGLIGNQSEPRVNTGIAPASDFGNRGFIGDGMGVTVCHPQIVEPGEYFTAATAMAVFMDVIITGSVTFEIFPSVTWALLTPESVF
jgi:hypothetical protein